MTSTQQEAPSGGSGGQPAGEPFGPYVVYERLGIGGMATVHRARALGIEGFERIVALKRLLPHLGEDESFVRAFVREAKMASVLQHANIVQLYELGRVGHEYYIAMEYIEGRDVRRLLRQARRIAGPPPIGVVVGLLSQLCDALDHAHTRRDEDGTPLGLVHRDVSPSNLLVSHSGHLKVIDFGIARAQAQHLRTETGRVKGKLAYMAPEASRGRAPDARSDLFSTGVCAHELLTARPLFASKNDYQTLMRVQQVEVAPPSTYNRDCPRKLDAIVLRALAKDPAERWQSAAELRDALDELRSTYQLDTSTRTIAAWMRLAFRLVVPPAPPAPADAPPASGPRRVAPGASDEDTGPTDLVAVPAADADDELVDLAWGAREEGAPVVLDEVPDRSDASGPTRRPEVRTPAVWRTPAPHAPRATTATPRLAGGSDLPRVVFHDKNDASGSHPTLGRRPRTASGTTPPAPTREPTDEPRPERVAVEVGAGILARRRASRALPIVAVLAIAAAAALLLSAGEHRAPAFLSGSDAATLRVLTEPADAIVTVQGRPPQEGSPFGAPLPPGSYRVEVRRAGYQSWTSTIELGARENHTVRIVLERAPDPDDSPAPP